MKNKKFKIENILSDNIVDIDDLREVPLERRIFIFFMIFLFVVFGFTLIMFAKVAIFKNNFYSARAIRNMSNINIIPAARGMIEDRFGKMLVHNEPSFNVFLLPRYLPKNSGERNKIILDISKIIKSDFGSLIKKISERDWNLTDRLLIKNDISQDELIKFSSLDLPWIKIEPGFKRVQNIQFSFSHLIGYTGLVNADDIEKNPNFVIDDEIGRDGLESYYDDSLRGINGEKIIFKDARGNIEDDKITREPIPGKSLYTFIDRDFQKYFYERLKRRISALKVSVGLGIALNPQNGEVLAIFNIPGYDTSRISSYLKAKSKPLFNRAVSGRYNPGSTIKPLVATAALKEGIISPEKQIYSKGYIDVPNPYNPSLPSRFVDWRPQGWVDVISALARSSNVYFYEVGGGFEKQKGLGITLLNKWWKKFNLNKKTNIDLPGESYGFLPNPRWKEEKTGQPWRLGDTYHVSIGQGDLSITPLELITYTSAIANGGTLYQPRIVDKILDKGRKVIKQTKPTIINDLKSEISDVLQYVHKGMREAVTKPYGTAHILGDLPFTSAAKTGSAQVQNNTKTNAFFVGYAPYKNPQIAILVLIENSKEGSSNTVPVAKDVLLWYYQNRLKMKNK